MEDKSGTTESEQKQEPILMRLLNPYYQLWDKLTGEDRRRKFDDELTKAKEALDEAVRKSEDQHKAYEMAIAEKSEKKVELQKQHFSACEAVEAASKYEDETRGTPKAKEARDAHKSATAKRDRVSLQLDAVEDTWPKRSACTEAEAQLKEKIKSWQGANNNKSLEDGVFYRRSKSLAIMTTVASVGFSACFALYNMKEQWKRNEEQKTQFEALAKAQKTQVEDLAKEQKTQFERLEQLAKGHGTKLESLQYKGETKIEPTKVGGEKKSSPPPEPSLEVCEKRRMVADFLLVGVVALAVWGRGGS